jgi:hypothetical protein
MRTCIGCDMLEYVDVVGWMKDLRRACEAVGRRDGLSLWHVNFRVS